MRFIGSIVGVGAFLLIIVTTCVPYTRNVPRSGELVVSPAEAATPACAPCPVCEVCEEVTCPKPRPCRSAPTGGGAGSNATLDSLGVRTVTEGCPPGLTCLDWNGNLDLIMKLSGR